MHESGIDFDRAAHPQRVYVDSIPDWQLSVVADQVMQGRPKTTMQIGWPGQVAELVSLRTCA